jgi:hypothetical protein
MAKNMRFLGGGNGHDSITKTASRGNGLIFHV